MTRSSSMRHCRPVFEVCLLREGAGDGNGGALGKVQVCIGEDRGEIPGYLACQFVTVGTRLQQPRAAERRPGANPEKNIKLGRSHCCIAPICFRITDGSFFYARVLNIVVMWLATGVSAVTHVEGISG